MSSKKYWVDKYIKARKEGNDIARRRAYNELLKILGRDLKEKDIK